MRSQPAIAGDPPAAWFESAERLTLALEAVDYVSDDATASAAYLAAMLGKPLLVEGPAGVGKTELAKAVARAAGARLIRLQCYEGLDESKALYEWNYSKQLLWIQALREQGADLDRVRTDIFTEEFLLPRPLLQCIRADDRVVLLIDEIDRVDMETEALMLEVLSEWQVSIPELGTVMASRMPMAFLTSNSSREMSEALKRRCLYLYLDYPDQTREMKIISARVPGLPDTIVSQVAGVVAMLRSLELRKRPSVSESVDWARTLLLAGSDGIGTDEVRDGLGVLLKHRSDLDHVRAELSNLTTSL